MYLFCFTWGWGLAGILIGYNIGSASNLLFNIYLVTFKEWKMYDFKNLVEQVIEEDDENFYLDISGR